VVGPSNDGPVMPWRNSTQPPIPYIGRCRNDSARCAQSAPKAERWSDGIDAHEEFGPLVGGTQSNGIFSSLQMKYPIQ